MQRERAQAPAADLLLELSARADEDRRGTGLVERDARARDLGAGCTPQADELAGAFDHGDHDAMAVVERVALGGIEDGLHSALVDDAMSW